MSNNPGRRMSRRRTQTPKDIEMEGVTPAAPTPQPVALVARVEILMTDDGKLIVNQQTPDPIFCVGMLETAKFSVLNAKQTAPAPKPMIEVPPPEAVPLLNGTRR